MPVYEMPVDSNGGDDRIAETLGLAREAALEDADDPEFLEVLLGIIRTEAGLYPPAEYDPPAVQEVSVHAVLVEPGGNFRTLSLADTHEIDPNRASAAVDVITACLLNSVHD